jgi:DNA-binding transcriptional regulator YiaG
MLVNMPNTSGLTEVITAKLKARGLPAPSECLRIRREAGIAGADIAAALGVSRQAVDQWERGLRRPRGQLAADYMDLLRALKAAL